MVNKYVFFRSYENEHNFSIVLPHQDIQYLPLKYNLSYMSTITYALLQTQVSFGTNNKVILRNAITNQLRPKKQF